MDLDSKFVDTHWIRAGKDYNTVPLSVTLAANERLAIPGIVLASLPATALPVIEFLSCTLPRVSVDTISTKIQMWFSQEPPSIVHVHEIFVSRPIPSNEFVSRLSKAVGQAWLDGAQSVIDCRFNNGNERLPLWAIAYWTKILELRGIQSLWQSSVDWLDKEEKGQKAKGPVSDDLIGVRTLLHTSVAWDSTMPHCNGMTSTSKLSRFLGPRWLSNDNIDMMVEELVLDLQGDKDRSHIQVVSLNFPNAISNVVTNLARLPSARTKSFLGQIERKVNDEGLQKLYFPLYVSGNHWIACEIDFKKKTFAFGDSIHSDRNQDVPVAPSNFVNSLQTWFETCFGKPFENRGNTLAHAVQDDTFSCGIITINTIEHAIFGRALWEHNCSSKERLAWFKRLALASIKTEGSRQPITPDPEPIPTKSQLPIRTGNAETGCELPSLGSHSDIASLAPHPKHPTASLVSLSSTPAGFPPEQSVSERSAQYLSAIRQHSLIIRRFPWKTPLITIAESRILSTFDRASEGGRANSNEDEDRQGLVSFLTRLECFERTVSEEFSRDGRLLREMLGYRPPSNINVLTHLNNDLSADISAERPPLVPLERFHSLISLYSFAELMVRMHGLPLKKPAVIHSTLAEADTNGLHGWAKLKDWPRICLNFRKAIQKDGIDLTILPNTSDKRAGFLKNMSHLFTEKDAIKIQLNFQVAALHMAYLLRTSSDAMGQHPDMPDTIEEILNDQPLRNQLEHAEIDKLKSRLLSKLRMPLQFSLLISPLFLLMPITLLRKWPRHRIIEVSCSLGNAKPPLLCKVEDAIWQTLYAVAMGHDSMSNAIASLCLSLPWGDLEDLKCGVDFEFFHPSKLATDQIHKATRETVNANAMESQHHLFTPIHKNGPQDTPETPEVGMDVGLQNEGTDGHVRHLGSSNSDSKTGEGAGDSNDAHGGFEGGIESEGVTHSSDKRVGASVGEKDGDLVGNSRGGQNGASDGTGYIQIGKNGRLNQDESETAGGGSDDEDPPNDDENPSCSEDNHGSSDDHMDMDHNGVALSEQRQKRKTSPEMEPDLDLEPRKRSRSAGTKAPAAASKPKPKQQKKTTSAARNLKASTPAISETNLSRTMFWIPVDHHPFKKEEITLEVPKPEEAKFKFVESPEPITAFTATGNSYTFSIKVHHKATLDTILSFEKAVAANYVDGVPLHIARPNDSIFCIMPEAEYLQKSPREVQEILRTQNIVITDRSESSLEFDKKGLRSLCQNLSNSVTIQDQSLPLTNDKNTRLRQGSLDQIYAASQMPESKVLNALTFPFLVSSAFGDPFSTDFTAYMNNPQSEGMSLGVPVPDIRWGLCATKGAWHGFHIDSDGYGTFIDVKTGRKRWIVARPWKKGMAGLRDFASINMFMNNSYSPDKPGESLWVLEAIILEPGTRLIMRPNTPHAVFTPENAICHGGHYYAATTMTDTFYGISHCFNADRLLTNVQHQNSRRMIRKIIDLYYSAFVEESIDVDSPAWEFIPHLKTPDSCNDLLAVCNLGILLNILDFETYSYPGQGHNTKISKDQKNQLYQYDYNMMPLMDRKACVIARGQAMELHRWFFSHFLAPEDRHATGLEESSILSTLASQLSALVGYKNLTEARGVQGAPNCTSEALERQMQRLFPTESYYASAVPASERLSSTSMAFPELAYTARNESLEFERCDNIEGLGLTLNDRSFFEGITMKIESTN